MPVPLKIDFVSDVACPWCAVGLASLEAALARFGDRVQANWRFQPFELNPDLPREGEDAVEHLARKYGIGAEQIARNGEAITRRGAELGFEFRMDLRRKVVNTFDAHRLLHWAEGEGQAQQRALKHALLRAYFSEGRDVSDREVLVEVAAGAGLDPQRARELLDADTFAAEVRQRERFYTGLGISAVPSVIFNDQHLVQGGQPVEVFERVIGELTGLADAA